MESSKKAKSSATDAMTVGFCGFGVMGSALAKGMLARNPQTRIFAFDPFPTPVAKDVPVQWLKSNDEVVLKQPHVIFLATKPQYIVPVCEELKVSLKVDKTVIVSLAAGVPTSKMEAALPAGARLIRCMPNIPCTVQAMASAICSGRKATKDDMDFVTDLLAPLGTCLQVPNEDMMHGVTGVSGSGPAYVFMMIEALADGGVRNGLPRATALELAMHTVKGAAEMCIQTKLHPGVLKDQVCSPGGTTIAAVAALEAKGLRSVFIEGVTAATQRSKELSQL